MHGALLDPAIAPDALLAKLNELEKARAEHPERRRVPQAAYEEIRRVLTDPEARRGAPAASTPRALDDLTRPPGVIYLQPSPALSQFQSVISYCLENELVSAGELPPSEHGLKLWVSELIDRLRPFGPCDIRWIEPKLLKLATDLTDDKRPFPDRRPGTVALADRARVFIIGDWATGLPQARNVARSVTAQLGATDPAVECHVVHLGDTYYSGLEEEYKHRFLPLWPVERGSRVRSWAINGNHDMYSGGHGYFDVLLKDPRFQAQQGSSYFCLGNQYWRLIGLDDSYSDPDAPSLAGSQVDWLAGLLAPADRPGTVLLTHHPAFSAWEPVNSTMVEQVAGAIGDRQVEGWLWGHEHRAAVYKPGVKYGKYDNQAAFTAILGHGGVPNLVSGPQAPAPPDAVDRSSIDWQNTDNYTVAEDTWSYGGYGVIDFDHEAASIQFFTEVGQPRTNPDGTVRPPDPLARVP